MMAPVRDAKAETSESELPPREARLARHDDAPHAPPLHGTREAVARELAAELRAPRAEASKEANREQIPGTPRAPRAPSA